MGGDVIGTGVRAYLRLLRYGPAARPFIAATIARLPIAMAPIGILLLVQQERGAYSIAGLVTGAFAVGSAAGTPVWGRLMDRFGQTRVLLPTSTASATLLVSLALATVLGGPIALLVVLAALAGLSFPPMSPAMRAAWRVVFPDPASRRVAFALDATSVELIFVGGPLLLSALLAFSVPVIPLLVTAGLMAGGGIAYCRTDAARQCRPVHPGQGDPETATFPPHRGERSALAATGVAAVLFVMIALSVGFGQLDTSMAATAGELLGGTQRVGLLFAAIAGGSAIGGLAFGARAWRFEERRAVPVLLGLFAVLLGVMALLIGIPHLSLWVLMPLLFVTGVTIAPTLIMQQNLLDHLAPQHRLNEAQALLSASNTTGAAAGTALAGVLIDFHGLNWSFGGAAIGVASAALIATISQRHWRAASVAVQERTASHAATRR
ncbi:MFS transporter [Microlunatus panaciterrae]|uniref:MFS family permease n=1 Tax=Microlunatus panaciterrae TaxID=400768 RepID=A0ABS2RFQ9_9ACTN|nr:MFS family permease [Microlunatus panaciterrae]